MFGTVKLVQEVTRTNQASVIVDDHSIRNSVYNVNKIHLIDNIKTPIKSYIHQSCQPIPISFTALSAPKLLSYKNLFSNNRKPTRRNSKYTVRHHRHRQPSIKPIEAKSKSQKILCLWPLPIVTRYIIFFSFFLSTLNWLNILDLSFTAPSHIFYRLDFKNLLCSPFLFDFTTIALFCWNVLILGLFEESLTHLVGSTRRFIVLLASLACTVLMVRNILGFVFSKSTGWALPFLFFSDAMHETSQGLSPFLFGLLVVQSLSIEDKYILIYGQENSNHKITTHKVTLQLLMCLVNYTTGNIYWWSLSGLLSGFALCMILQFILAREKRQDANQVKSVYEYINLEQYRRMPIWRLLASGLKKSSIVVCSAIMTLRLFSMYYNQHHLVSTIDLQQLVGSQQLFTFLFMTAPRRGDPPYLTKTIDSYLSHWPSHHTPYQAIVYTHFTNHTQYDLAHDYFTTTNKGQQYLHWVREEGSDWNQRLHVSKALKLATDQYKSTYYALMEDDFPVCGAREWHEIETVIYKAQKHYPNHCGVFVGTGGSGLFLKPEIARLTSELLLKYVDIPPDIIIQKCLMGELDECAHCQDTLVTSKTLLMYHIGYNASTSEDRAYKKDEFQCGWRHPFNGDPSVITL